MDEKLVDEITKKISYCKRNTHHNKRRREGHKVVLQYLSSKGGSALSGDISCNVGISTSRLAYILRELEEHGMIERKILEDDKRKVCVSLTNKALEKINEKHKHYHDFIDKLLNKLDDNDKKALIRILDAIEEISKE